VISADPHEVRAANRPVSVPHTDAPIDDAALDAFVARLCAADVRAGARAMRLIDDRHPVAVRLLQRIHPHTGRAAVVGVTGNPGTGKSTLTDQLVRHYRAAGMRVGVVAVDPSSPFSGGAILGDRIRMNDHATDPGVFIRSLATRGHLGGLSRSTHDVVQVLDAMGYDPIIIETVGVGQDEVDVVRLADTSLVVTVPGLGDDVQAIKAGLLEIADVFVVNKADLEGVEHTVRDLRGLQSLATPAGGAWTAPVIRTVATRGEGVPALVAAIEAHREHIADGDAGAARARARAARALEGILLDMLRQRVSDALAGRAGAHELLDRLVARQTDPYTEAERLLAAIAPIDGEAT